MNGCLDNSYNDERRERNDLECLRNITSFGEPATRCRAALGALPSNPGDDFPLPRTSPKGLDRSDREINIGYRCVMAPRSIVLIGQSDFNGAGRS